MELAKAIQDVQNAAAADSTGTGQRHVDLLEAIRRLNLVAEAPAETLMRMRFEVMLAIGQISPQKPHQSCIRGHLLKASIPYSR